MAHFAVTAVGSDRPGIVAAVTAVLMARGCNLEDTSMSILRGHFAMMLVVAAPDDADATELERAITEQVARLDLVVAVRRIDDEVPASPPGDAYSLSVYGADRPGIVHQVSQLLADRGVNIVDLTTRVIGDADRPVYVMLLDLTLPPGVPVADLEHALAGLARDLGVDCTLHAAEAEIL